MIHETTDNDRMFDVTPDATVVALSLRDRYMVPPFSILDTRQGYWQERRGQWDALGIQGEIGRAHNLTIGEFVNPDISSFGAKFKCEGGTSSIFDPVLTELAYRWFAPPGGVIVDPFAGGSVRGIIASAMGRAYTGIELRGEQIEANRAQAQSILRPGQTGAAPVFLPQWIEGDAAAVPMPRADLVFTCPPYGDLEVYSDDPRDLSTMNEAGFDAAYRTIISRAVQCLLPNRFACVVIGNVRDKRGRLRDLCGLTIRAFEDAGAAYYNEAILLNATGTGAVRARRQFDTSRKLVRLHQTVLVFCKGDPRLAVAAIDAGVDLLEDAA